MPIRQILTITLLALLPIGQSSADTRLDMAAIVKEVEILKNVDDTMTLVMSMPEEYWRAAIQSSGSLTDKGADEFLKALAPYTMVAVLAAKTGAAGAFTFAPAAELRRNTRLEDRAGSVYEPLDPQIANASVKNLLQLIRPILTNAMGPMGTNMEIMHFPATNTEGVRIADATKDGLVHHARERPGAALSPAAGQRPPRGGRSAHG